MRFFIVKRFTFAPMSLPIRNIALFAHVDAGKTSITEAFLYHSGKIRNFGSVDKGNTRTDALTVERERGISVKSGIVSFEWQQHEVHLIDTPGHIDFSAETEKAFYAIDAAVVVVSAVEGVQAQTENMIEALLQFQMPFLIFINKIDREGADIENIVSDLHRIFGLQTFEMQKVNHQGEIVCLWNEKSYQNQEALIEKIVAEDENLMMNYLEGNIPEFAGLQNQLIALTHRQKMIPLLVGSAKKNRGVKWLLDAVITYLPAPPQNTIELMGMVFGVKHIPRRGKWTGIRLLSGRIKARETIYNATAEKEEKIGNIESVDMLQPKILEAFSAGQMAWVQGMEFAKPGDFIGRIPDDYKQKKLSKSLLQVQVIPDDAGKTQQLIDALNILHNEDPDLNFHYQRESASFSIDIRGEVQKEILQTMLKQRFDLDVTFYPPTVIYKETPTQTAYGYVRYWLPKPCWAIMKFKIEPGARGSGVQYRSEVSVNDIKQRYQNDVAKAIPTALKQGILGWEVDDVIITLIEGEDHEVHTKSNDFTIATPMGIMDGLAKAEMTLLEPVLTYKITTPEAFLGNIAGELTRARATIKAQEINGETALIGGKIPLATSLELPIKINAISGGKAKLRLQFSGYETCDVSLGKTREYMGISPLDTAKYILKARRALGE